MKPKILCIADYYLPGFKAGGAIRTIANMVSHLNKDFDFWIITRDRDAYSSESYHVSVNEWNNVDQAKVFYASPGRFSFLGILHLLNEIEHDILYLNSYFSIKATIYPLVARYFRIYENAPIVIAPRGEFSAGALKLKALKKRLFITVANCVGLYRDVVWQASSEHEAQDIRNATTAISPHSIAVAPDCMPFSLGHCKVGGGEWISNGNAIRSIRIVYISRISRKKNLHYLLCALKKVKSQIKLSIYGPLEDIHYWTECKDLIDKLPINIKIEYKGLLTHDAIPNAFANHDVFFFPTMGENYGHVIFESLAAGTCVVLSDQTPWQHDVNGSVEIIGLENSDAWSEAIDRWAEYPSDVLLTRRNAAFQYINRYIADSKVVEKNRILFLDVLGLH